MSVQRNCGWKLDPWHLCNFFTALIENFDEPSKNEATTEATADTTPMESTDTPSEPTPASTEAS